MALLAYSAQTFQIGPQGRIVIPAAIRTALKLVAGTSVRATVEAGRLILQPQEPPLKRFLTRFDSAPPSPAKLVSDELIEERRREALRDEAA